MNYKPFDLEAAKRGEAIICRDGTPSKFLAHFPEAGEEYRVYALTQGCKSPQSYCENGMWCKNCDAQNDDLFMAPIPKPRVKGWTNIYPMENGKFTHGWHDIFETKEEAMHRATRDCVGQIYIDQEIE